MIVLETCVEENKPNQVLRLKDIINIPTDEGNIGKNDLTMNTYNNCEAIPARNTYLFQNNYENSAAYYNQQIYQSQQARSFNMYETSPNRFSHSTSTVYPWLLIMRPLNLLQILAFVPCIQTDRLLSETELVNYVFTSLNSLNYFTNFRDLLPLIEYHYTFKNIKNASAVILHSRILDNIRINEMRIKKITKTADEDMQRNWSLFTEKFSKIKIIDYDSPLVSFFPGIIMLKDFIYKLLLGKVLQDRNIFNIFVGMKMIESLLFSSKEMIAGLSTENSLDIFSYGHGAKNIINVHKKMFFTILKKILCKNFNLSRNFFYNIEKNIIITEIGCDYLSDDKLYLNKAYKCHFLRTFIDSIFFLDDVLMNTVSNIYEKSIIDVDLQTGFVVHTFFDFSILEKIEIVPGLSLKFIKYYLILLQKEEFISSGNINQIVFKDVIENLTIEVDNFEKELTKPCSSQPKKPINLLFKCLCIFNFIIKCGFNRNIHNSLYLERISEISIL
ncbi:hypothetical protein CWI39_0152p0020 [Hamiltosporidium magnivora]|uniref:Uncharacterized protein n=1 Tax=Hamiltosporidium magnivora TaxID=148818 RepID=A0A4Q9LML3_9MICR|nr:hypothetical protein CWI39_0152p0020 [Hamiltosporidium magnivora]